jgi:YbbR-like protein
MKLRNIVLDNWGLKAISLGLSLILWFYVTSKGKTEMMLTVPLELRNIPQNMAVVGNVAGYLEVRVQAQERVLRDITTGKKVVCILDLSMTKVGENIVRISPDDIKRPADVAVTYMSLSDIKVKLEPLVRKTFRLKPVLHGRPAPGFHVVRVRITPPRITAEGPSSVMAALGRLRTIPIDIEGAQEDVTVSPKIDYEGQPVKLLAKDISLQVVIERNVK